MCAARTVREGLPERNYYYTAAEYAAAKETSIAAFLMSIGYELNRSGNGYTGKLHDSLVIRDDGRWYWNSRGVGGRSPVELFKHILMVDYGFTDEITAAIEAVKQLAGGQGQHMALEPVPIPRPDHITLPPASASSNRVMAYLCQTRGLDAGIVRELIRQHKIYETRDYHNAAFVAYDSRGSPRYAALRGTSTFAEKPFKSEVPLSDKSYPFTLSGHSRSDRVFCFESAVDAISHASLFKMLDADWREGHRISLGGTSFLGLDRFLSENTQVRMIVSCLDNDAAGNRRSKKLMELYSEKGYTMLRKPSMLKDYNEDLLDVRQDEQEEDELEL